MRWQLISAALVLGCAGISAAQTSATLRDPRTAERTGWRALDPAVRPASGTLPIDAATAVVGATGFEPAAAAAATATVGAPPVATAGPATSATATPPGRTQGADASRSPTSPPAAAPPARRTAQVTKGSGTLPNEHGQVWREYDITPYTSRVTATERPEQALVDWILRETGYEVWHSEPLGVLSATRKSLRVYHTPEVQAKVAQVVDRFVASEGDTFTFTLRMVTLDSPAWRGRAQRVLKPVAVQTPGAAAWLLEKEDAALLVADLQRRSDYREHSSPHLIVSNGQPASIAAKRPRGYVRDVVARPDLPLGYEQQIGQVEEGYSLDLSPLVSLDRKLIDATLKYEIDQVEKMTPVLLDFAAPNGQRTRAKLDVPQISHFRFHERFRWPLEQVLLVSGGMVAMPLPVDTKPNVAGIPLPGVGGGPPRGELLVFVECRGQGISNPRTGTPNPREAKNYHGRY